MLYVNLLLDFFHWINNLFLIKYKFLTLKKIKIKTQKKIVTHYVQKTKLIFSNFFVETHKK